MTDIEQHDVQKDHQSPAPLPKKRNILRNILLSVGVLIVFIAAALAVMFSTDKGSEFLLDRVLARQQIIHYEYESGNLLQGIILKNLSVTLKAVDVKVDRADVSLGWRAILDKEIHLSHADINNLRVISKSAPSNEPLNLVKLNCHLFYA